MSGQISLLVSGYVKVYAELGNQYRIIDVLKKDRIIDLLSVLGQDVYNLSATALNDVEILSFEKENLLKVLNKNERFRNCRHFSTPYRYLFYQINN